MARHILGILAGAIVGFVGIVIAVVLLTVISLAGLLDIPKVVEFVLVCIVAGGAAYAAGRVGRTDGVVMGAIAALIVEALLLLFQREGSSVQIGASESGVVQQKIWFAGRIVLGMIMGAQGAYVWRRKAERIEAMPGEPLPETGTVEPSATLPANGLDDEG